MQIDFHHAVTYVLARNANFTHEEAEVIAYAAQYVDDADSSKPICFHNGAMYQPIASSHPSADPANLDNSQNRMTWLPFHFLPGNGNLPPGRSPSDRFIDRLVCTPDSQVARDMIRSCMKDASDPERRDGLQRLGITMHVYADTFAHQNFAGVRDGINDVDNVQETGEIHHLPGGIQSWLNSLLDQTVPPVGHGRALTFPDMPFLQWEYRNGRNEMVRRDNTAIFLDAAEALCRVMQTCHDGTTDPVGINSGDRGSMRELLLTLTNTDPNVRHAAWIQAIQDGRFSFGPATIKYDAGAWRAEALGTAEKLDQYYYNPGFLTTRWKYFQDALQRHRLTILHDVLPKYGICTG
jgi:hypothetical protein